MARARNTELDVAPWWVTDNKSLWNYINAGLGDAVDDLNDVIEWLREDGHYQQSDRIRTIAGRLARLQRPAWEREENMPPLIREIARGW